MARPAVPASGNGGGAARGYCQRALRSAASSTQRDVEKQHVLMRSPVDGLKNAPVRVPVIQAELTATQIQQKMRSSVPGVNFFLDSYDRQRARRTANCSS